MNRDQLADWLHCLQGGMYDWVQEEIRKELAKPEQAVVPFPSFMRRRIEQAMEDAIHPTGMSVHDGKAKVLASDLHRMLLVIDSVPQRKPWVGLTDDEKNNCLVEADPCEALATPEAQELMREVEAKLKEKNDD